MFRLVSVTVSILFLFASYAAAGQSGNYAGVSTGISIIDQRTVTDRNGTEAEMSFDVGIPVSIYGGHQFESGLRIDAELSYKYVAVKNVAYAQQTFKPDSDVQSYGAMGNVYYNFYHGFADAPWSPYLGVGMGVANVHLSEASDNRFTYWTDDDDTVFAYQTIIGFNVPLRKNILLDVSYRYLGTSDIHIDQIKTDINNHNVLLGIRYFW